MLAIENKSKSKCSIGISLSKCDFLKLSRRHCGKTLIKVSSLRTKWNNILNSILRLHAGAGLLNCEAVG